MFSLSCKLSEIYYTSQTDIIDAVDFNSEDIMDLREMVRRNQRLIKQNRDQNQEIQSILLRINERLDRLEKKQLELSVEVKAKSIIISGFQETYRV